jgi:hypothetical protein
MHRNCSVRPVTEVRNLLRLTAAITTTTNTTPPPPTTILAAASVWLFGDVIAPVQIT